MTWIGHLDLVLLAMMLASVVVTTLRFCCRSSKPAVGVFNIFNSPTNRKRRFDQFSYAINHLESIAAMAPFLGLAGTCLSILSIFRGYSGSRHGFIVMVLSGMVPALVTTAAGMLVAIPATWSYQYLLRKLDLLQPAAQGESLYKATQSFQFAQRLPLKKRFSELPAYALIAAPALVIAVTALMMFASFRIPAGFVIEVASPACEGDRLIVVHLTDTGQLFINFEPVDRSALAYRLSQIYRTRAQRTLYLSVDDDVHFQSVAEVLDIVRNSFDTTVASQPTIFSKPEMVNLNIKVRLVTPALAKAGCPTSILKP